MKILTALILIVSISFSSFGYVPTIKENTHNFSYSTNDISAKLESKLSDTCTINYSWLDTLSKEELEAIKDCKDINLGNCTLLQAAQFTGQWWRSHGLNHDYSNTKSAMCDLLNPPQAIRQDCSGYVYLVLALYLDSGYSISLAANNVQSSSVYTGNIWEQLSGVPAARDKLEKVDITTFEQLKVGDITVQPYFHTMVITELGDNTLTTYDEAAENWPGSKKLTSVVDGCFWPYSSSFVNSVPNRNTAGKYSAMSTRTISPIKYIVRGK